MSRTRAAYFAEIRDRMEDRGVTFHEELASTLVHVVGAVLATAALVLLMVLASDTGSARAITACAIYGSTAVLMFVVSATYHGVWHSGAKAAFLVLDHCAIFILIAGTYTPVVLLALPHTLGWTLLGVIWGLAALGIVARLWIGHLHWILIPIFVAMGWLGFAWADTLFAAMGDSGGWLLLSGGIVYTGGLVFFAWRNLPFNHAIWHVFVLGGAVCHFLAVAIYAVPKAM